MSAEQDLEVGGIGPTETTPLSNASSDDNTTSTVATSSRTRYYLGNSQLTQDWKLTILDYVASIFAFMLGFYSVYRNMDFEESLQQSYKHLSGELRFLFILLIVLVGLSLFSFLMLILGMFGVKNKLVGAFVGFWGCCIREDKFHTKYEWRVNVLAKGFLTRRILSITVIGTLSLVFVENAQNKGLSYVILAYFIFEGFLYLIDFWSFRKDIHCCANCSSWAKDD